MKKQLIVIAGPTASGKTQLSIDLAKYFKTVIVSADSRQFYQEISIGTAKPTSEEMNGVKHYFIDSHKLKDEVSSAKYEKEALRVLEQEFKNQNIIIVVGGSGMFIDALCFGLDNVPADTKIKTQLIKEWKENGLEKLNEELKRVDPEYFAVVDKKNPNRVIRGLEVYRTSGKPFSSFRQKKVQKRPFEVHIFVLNHEREILYNRINQRVDFMVQQGLFEEAESVKHWKELTSLNTVGYKEIFSYFDGEVSKSDAIELIKRNSRRYAKRQLTWFRRNPQNIWLNYTTNKDVMKQIIDYLAKLPSQ